MMIKALYPGSFDPVTRGHVDIIERVSKSFGHLYIGIIENASKDAMFSIEERLILMEEATAHLRNVSVISFSGLTVKYAEEIKASALIRGLRAISDFEYELQLASTNRRINPEIETLFLMASTKYSYVSSSLVKELSLYDSDISFYVPACVEKALADKKMEGK
ncbi:pantetheine-phosphate adenylyltransferase [Erysipelotrichaceae bacterium]|nr:pantetheine-phosphate adenylyltransferase [Erysipelotrichaceae bacterium]